MTRRLSLKRPIDVTDQQGSVKRLKSRKLERHQRHDPSHQIYSTRRIPWEEQKRLGGDFAEAGQDCWPALKILGEAVRGRSKQYLVAWKPHPETGEEFKPDWLAPVNVGDDLIAIWKQLEGTDTLDPAHQKDKSRARWARNRRILPNSSDTPNDILDQQSDAAHSPPSLLSGSSLSGLEISETQDVKDITIEPPRVNIPPLPTDKHDYETIGSSQFNSSTPALYDHLFPDVQFNLPSSQKAAPDQIVLASYTQPLSQPGGDLVIDGSQTPQSKVTESSPRTSSARSHPRSNLSTVLVSAQDDISANIRSSTQSLNFVTQLAASQSHSSPFLSPTSPKRSVRLSSPFQDTIAVANSSSPTRSPRVRRASSIRRRATGGERLQEDLDADSEIQASPSSSPGSRIADEVPELLARTADSVTETSLHPVTVIMASSNIGMAPLESKDHHLFSTHSSATFDLPHDANALTLTIHESIEDEPNSSAENSQLLNSKANSSQESLNNEREVETVDGIMIPVRPLLGPNEFAISLPAEGKVKSQYDEIIKLQKKAIIRFISRTGSPGTSDISSKKTVERNAMQDLLQQLNNTVTHTDLGLPMHTQYSLDSNANAAYAEYAGTKFELLGYFADSLREKDCSIALFAQSGPLQDMLEEYLAMKRVHIRRHDRLDSSSSDGIAQGLSIDLFTTQSVNIHPTQRKPLFIIAFDVSFTSSDPQVQSLQGTSLDNVPIVHLLVTNSSEHVEKCVPDTLTSNIRLKVVVRTTYLASRNLGGDITYVPEDSDQPDDGRQMDMLQFQRAIRKSPARRLFLIADVVASLAVSGDLATSWPLGSMPELKLNELESPPKVSRAGSRTPQPRITRQSTPVSRAATPVAKKRLLDIENENGSKRQRLTPVRDLLPESATVQPVSEDVVGARKQITALTTELASIKTALLAAEQSRTTANAKAGEWEKSHADLLRRFEKDRNKSRDLQKENAELNLVISNYQERDEAHRNEKTLLRQQLADDKGDLLQARKELTSAGGDTAELENAREEARSLSAKLQALEKTMKAVQSDFDFTRDQYQASSKLAMDRTTEVRSLEDQVEKLKIAADDNKRSLKAMNYETSLTMAMNKAEQFRLEVKNRQALIRKLQEENATLKSRRGVQTRGSSIQPATSPGPRSRQASPAATHLMPPSGSRASVLRHER